MESNWLHYFGVWGNPLGYGGFWVPPFFWWVGFILTIVLLYWIVYSIIGLQRIYKNSEENYKKYFIKPPVEVIHNKRWERILDLFQSSDPDKWRIAIIEADTMLDQLLIDLGYRGDSMGERLKIIEESDFPTLHHAWEVHKLRNRIAHDSAFRLSPDMAAHAMRLYEFIFEDSRYI